MVRVLARRRLRRFISQEDSDEFVDSLALAADVRDDPYPISGLGPDDCGDDYLVALARETGAEYLLASDQHLIGLDSPACRRFESFRGDHEFEFGSWLGSDP